MKRLILALVVGGALFTAAWGAAADITVNDGHVGAGSGTVSGYTVTNVHWVISGNQVTDVEFDISPDASTVNAKTNQEATWKSCSAPGSVGEWTCDLTDQGAQGVLSLAVVAAN